MQTLKTTNGIVMDYPGGCGNAPRKFFIVETLAAAAEKDKRFLADAFAEDVDVPELPQNIEKIIVQSVITHGRDAGFECTVYFTDRAPVAAGVFMTFKSAGKNVISRINVFTKEAEA